MPDESGIWIRTDEAEDVAASLRHVLRVWPVTKLDSQAWKWVALALHSALQGACVAHLVTTASPLGVVTDKNAKAWIDYLELSRADSTLLPPKTYLLPLPDLLKQARTVGPGGGGDARPIRISDAELNWLKRFNDEIRNQFVHFEPMGWSIEISGIPALARVVARIIGEILDRGWAFRRKDASWANALRADLAQVAALSK